MTKHAIPSVKTAAARLESLGNVTRLSIFRLLIKAGPAGLIMGELQQRMDMPASTLSHHVANLVQAGLVVQEREGRMLRCRPDFAQMNALLKFLTDECCSESGEC